MLHFTAVIQRSAKKGEKNGWTYVDVPADVITALKLTNRKEFRIKGLMDDVRFERLACYPVGEGQFIIAINATLRKQLGKKAGAQIQVQLTKDKREAAKSDDLLACLEEEPAAWQQFATLTKAHQNYFHNYINSAKGADTRAGRIVNTIQAMLKKQDFGTMIRSHQKKNLNGGS